MTELGSRILSAVILGPLVLGIVWLGGAAFVALSCVAAIIILWEWSRITRPIADDAALISAAAGAVGCVLLAGLAYWAAALLVLVAAATVGQFLAGRTDPARLLWLGVLYAALPAVALVVLRADPIHGAAAIFWLLLIVWASDIGAYFAGRLIGGPKLWPAVSPKKTWAGAVGGIVAAMLVASAFVHVFAAAVAFSASLLILSAFLSAISQLGDLAESGLKRRFAVKDSSTLIPGHGGLMDRVDGLLAAGLAAGIIGAFRGGSDAAGSGLLIW